ncbi:hypothetical protein EUX98_g6636 [Antrodiella citrinella]|uniref:DUF7702 domain-containing protein n=1 Tax=Antrodiella citrinella TaxID=2447956 RepID=A0A4S4MNN3_9APHY|nr:hypothetical protein EUX98_g6636 [Antrodiella citrinella]
MANPSTGLIETYFILDNVGLSPLMMATIGFLNTVGQGRFQENHRFTFIILRVLALVASVAMILTIIGGVDLVDAKTTDAVNAAEKYRHIGAIVYAALFGLITLMHFWFWIQAGQIMPRRRSMLLGISASIPFLFLRTAYSVLSSFAPTSLSSATPVATNTLSKFSTTTGSWQIYLGMSVAAELVVVIIYLVVGTTVPTSRELDDSMDGNYHDGNPSYKMYG